MSKKMKSILEAALALPAKDRGLLVGRLFESLPPPPGFIPMTEREFAAELRRRDREMEDGTDKGLSWAEVRKMR